MMDKKEIGWTVERLAAYLQGLVDAGLGKAPVLIENDQYFDDHGFVIDAKFVPDDAGVPTGCVGIHFLGISSHI